MIAQTIQLLQLYPFYAVSKRVEFAKGSDEYTTSLKKGLKKIRRQFKYKTL